MSRKAAEGARRSAGYPGIVIRREIAVQALLISCPVAAASRIGANGRPVPVFGGSTPPRGMLTAERHWGVRVRAKYRWACIIAALGVAFLLCVATLDFRHRPTTAEFEQIQIGMIATQVERTLGPPHKILTPDTDCETDDQEFYKPGPNDPIKVIFYYEGVVEQHGKSIHVFIVGFGDDGQVCRLGSGSHTNRRYPWRFQRWLRKTFGI